MTEDKHIDKSSVRWSIKWKLMAVMGLLMVGLIALLAYTQILTEKKILENELAHRIELMKENLIERGKSSIINLSQQVENHIATFNFSGARESILDVVNNNPEIKYAILMDAIGMVHIHTQRPNLVQTTLTNGRDKAALQTEDLKVLELEEDGESMIEIVSGIQFSTNPWGVLRVIYTLKPLEQQIEMSRKQFQNEMRKMIFRAILTSLAFLIGCVVIVFFISTKISTPLLQLTEFAKKLSKGDFSASSDIHIQSTDEVGVLSQTFTEMSHDLEESYQTIKDSETRYRSLFEYSPISLWEEDMSQVKVFIDKLRDDGVKDFKKYFEDHSKELLRCIEMVNISDVNQSTLELYGASSKEELVNDLEQVIAVRTLDALRDEIIALAEGTILETKCINRTLSGKDITVLKQVAIPPGYENTWSKVLVSVHDLTEQVRADFLQEMFGRYLSREVMNALLENPDAVKLGGEKRDVTIMMTDLRGFTALSERLDPGQVIQLLNGYFEVMMDIILKYNATINEIIGDAMVIIFGAPYKMEDRSQQAIACAIEMQNNMVRVNKNNRSKGLPDLEMGIGINDANVIVGNVGSSKRSKYSIVGSGVNMTSRIESYSVGGQILISESVLKETGDILRIDKMLNVLPKGMESSIIIYEVGGIGAPHNIALEEKDPVMDVLVHKIPLNYTLLGGKHILEEESKGLIVRLSAKSAEIEFYQPIELFADLKLNLVDVPEELASRHFYAKIVEQITKDRPNYVVRFTAIPPQIASYFIAHQQHTDVNVSKKMG